MTVESSTRRTAKDELPESWIRYACAPCDAFQDSVSVNGWPVAPLAGAERIGAGGGESTVAKCQTDDQELVPPAFLALTLQ